MTSTHTVIAYDINNKSTLQALGQGALRVCCSNGIHNYDLEDHLGDIDNLNLCMLRAETDIILVTKSFLPISEVTELADLIPDRVGIVGQASTLYHQSCLEINADRVEDATNLFCADQAAPSISNLFYLATPDAVWIKREVIERTRGFDPDFGPTIEGMADLCFRAYNLCGFYTWLSPKRVGERVECDGGNQKDILDRKYQIGEDSLISMIRRIYARKILTT